MNYREYLASHQWQERRLAKLEQARNKCQACGETRWLQVHHLRYDNLGFENTQDLVVLCQSCHWVADEMRKHPKSNIQAIINAPVAKSKDRTKREETDRQTTSLKHGGEKLQKVLKKEQHRRRAYSVRS